MPALQIIHGSLTLRPCPGSRPPLLSLCFTSDEKRLLLNHKPADPLCLRRVPRSWPKPFVELKC